MQCLSRKRRNVLEARLLWKGQMWTKTKQMCGQNKRQEETDFLQIESWLIYESFNHLPLFSYFDREECRKMREDKIKNCFNVGHLLYQKYFWWCGWVQETGDKIWKVWVHSWSTKDEKCICRQIYLRRKSGLMFSWTRYTYPLGDFWGCDMNIVPRVLFKFTYFTAKLMATKNTKLYQGAYIKGWYGIMIQAWQMIIKIILNGQFVWLLTPSPFRKCYQSDCWAHSSVVPFLVQAVIPLLILGSDPGMALTGTKKEYAFWWGIDYSSVLLNHVLFGTGLSKRNYMNDKEVVQD